MRGRGRADCRGCRHLRTAARLATGAACGESSSGPVTSHRRIRRSTRGLARRALSRGAGWHGRVAAPCRGHRCVRGCDCGCFRARATGPDRQGDHRS
ncbi:hypothetical protein ADK54_33310 [Streptomyces sp. WM6378]|nr:hypothetical protein ADK54_33310 [Streptomyces sp. WM6378]